MGLPIVQEIFDGIRWLIDFFIDKVPRPMKILIFLLFLLLFGSIISLFLQLAGVHCNASKEVVKVSTFDIGTNLALVWETSKRTFIEENLTICDVHPERCGSEHECYFFARQLDTGNYEECNTTNTSTDCKYYLKEGTCHNCTDGEICFQDSIILWFCGNWHDVCLDNAYPSEHGTLTDSLTGCGSSCYVPDHYLWNQTTGQYECVDSQYCGVGATIEADPIIDQKLKKAGAELIYKVSEGRQSYTRMIYIRCNNDYNPRLTFFGIDLLDYKLWLLMIVIYVLVVLFFKLKQK